MNTDLTMDFLVLRKGGGTTSTDSLYFELNSLYAEINQVEEVRNLLKQLLSDESISEIGFEREFVLVVDTPCFDEHGVFPDSVQSSGKIVHQSTIDLSTAYYWGIEENFGVRIYSKEQKR